MNWVEAEYAAARAIYVHPDDTWLRMEPEQECEHAWEVIAPMQTICTRCGCEA